MKVFADGKFLYLVDLDLLSPINKDPRQIRAINTTTEIISPESILNLPHPIFKEPSISETPKASTDFSIREVIQNVSGDNLM